VVAASTGDGQCSAKRMGGHRKRLLEPHRALVVERLKAVPGLTLKALVAELAEHGIATGSGQATRAVEEVSGAA
jgi:transposase